MNEKIKELSAMLATARSEESAANKRRVQLEEAIIAQLPDLKEKGSRSIDCENGLSLTITTGLTYKADFDRMPEELACKLVKEKVTYALDEKAYEALEGEERATAMQFIEVKPKKTSVSLKVK
jgi:hypothetical protein